MGPTPVRFSTSSQGEKGRMRQISLSLSLPLASFALPASHTLATTRSRAVRDEEDVEATSTLSGKALESTFLT